MPHRRAVAIAVASALLACLPSVDQVPQPDEIVLARFDTSGGVVPFPNDLALQTAALRPAGDPTKALLEGFIAAGGFPASFTLPGGAQPLSALVPVRALKKNAAGVYADPGAAPAFDAAELNAAVAFLRYDVSPPQKVPFAAVLLPQYPAGTPPQLQPVPPPVVAVAPKAALAAGGRYVVALRSGIAAGNGRTLGPDQVIALVAPNKDLATTPENRPPAPAGVSAQAWDAQMKQLDVLRQTFANPLPWTPITASNVGLQAVAICKQALGPTATAPCWLPCTPTLAAAVSAAGLCKQPVASDAFAAVDTVFPSAEAASIQTFNVAP